MNDDAHKIISTLGRAEIALAVGRSEASVKLAITKGMSPSWYSVVEEMCAQVGIACPRGAFNFLGKPDFCPSCSEAGS